MFLPFGQVKKNPKKGFNLEGQRLKNKKPINFLESNKKKLLWDFSTFYIFWKKIYIFFGPFFLFFLFQPIFLPFLCGILFSGKKKRFMAFWD